MRHHCQRHSYSVRVSQYSARHHLTNTARVPPKTCQNLERFCFRKETHEKNAFATILFFSPRVSLFRPKFKKKKLLTCREVPQCLSKISIPKKLENTRPPNEHVRVGFRELSDGTFPRAKQLVPECLNHVKIANICHYFWLCHRYLEAYR